MKLLRRRVREQDHHASHMGGRQWITEHCRYLGGKVFAILHFTEKKKTREGEQSRGKHQRQCTDCACTIIYAQRIAASYPEKPEVRGSPGAL